MKKKTLLTILLALCIAFCFLFTACDGNDADGDTNSGKGSAQQSADKVDSSTDNGGSTDSANTDNSGEDISDSVNSSGTPDSSDTKSSTTDSSRDEGDNSGSTDVENPDTPHTHVYSNWKTVTEPTCTETGLNEKKCTCGDMVTEAIPATGHKVVDGFCSVCKEKYTSTGLSYTLSDDGKSYTVLGIGTCTDTEIYIPSIYEGLPVTSIGGGAFYNCTSLTHIEIASSVTSIDYDAFHGCTSITGVTLEEGSQLTSIGNYAFAYCTNLLSIEIPSGVISLGGYAFENCTRLTIYCETESAPDGWWFNTGCPVVWDCNNNDVASDGYIYTIFDGLKYSIMDNVATIVKQPENIKGDIVIPSSISYKGASYPVTTIGDSAFLGCTSLTSVGISNGLTSIRKDAFSYCYCLTEIVIPSCVTNVDYHAFDYCYSLTVYFETQKKSEFPALYSVGAIVWDCTNNDVAEDGCVYTIVDGVRYALKDGVATVTRQARNLTEAPIHGCLTYKGGDYSVEAIGKSAFSDCRDLTSIAIPNSITSIGQYAFDYCSSLSAVYITDISAWCKMSIEDSPLEYAKKLYLNGELLTNLVIPDDITEIKDGTFKYCESLISVIMPEGVISIGEYAFGSCENITSVNIPNSVCSIEKYAFFNCVSLQSIVVPKGVTTISDGVFRYCEKLESVTFEGAITSIGASAFSHCYCLEGIVIPSSVTSIGETAFGNCTSLKSIYIPKETTEISLGAFAYCTNLEAIEIDEDNPNYKSENSVLYTKDGKTLMQYPIGKKETSFDIPNGVTVILNVAFAGSKNLINVSIPKGVITISYKAFEACENLASIVIPNTVKSIGKYAFYECGSLLSATIPNSVTTIGYCAFYNNATIIYYEESSIPNGWDEHMTANKLFVYNCKNNDVANDGYVYVIVDGIRYALKDGVAAVSILRSNIENLNILNEVVYKERIYPVTAIMDGAFSGCTSLKNVFIPSNVKSIGTYAFSGCTSLTNIKMPNGIISIGDSAFSDCNSLVYNEYDNGYYLGNDENLYVVFIKAKDTAITSCIVNENTRLIYNKAFAGCTSLANIEMPNDIISIGDYAFVDCDSLVYNEYDNGCYFGNDENSYVVFIKAKDTAITSCIVNKNTRLIYNEAFSGCTSLTNIEIPKGVTNIGDYAFRNCTKLTSVEIPNSVTSIGDYSFENCGNLRSITIPDSIVNIGYCAFGSCTCLESVNYTGEIANWCKIGGYNLLLYYANNLYLNGQLVRELVIPNTVIYISDYAFHGCTSITSVTFEEGSQLTSIGTAAFEYCSNMTSVKIPSSVTSIGNYAFGDCINLKSIEIPNSVTRIGAGTFSNCIQIKEATIPTIAISAIPKNYLEKVVINGGDRIGYRAFSSCNKLTSIEIPSSVTSIGDYAFYGCGALTSIEIPSSVTSIGERAFYKCTGLTIYCEAESQPGGWVYDWNYSNCPVVWGYDDEE